MDELSKKRLDIIERYFGLEKYHLVKESDPDAKIILEKLMTSEHCPFCNRLFKGSVMLCDGCNSLFCDRCDDRRNGELWDDKLCPDCIKEKEKNREIKTLDEL